MTSKEQTDYRQFLKDRYTHIMAEPVELTRWEEQAVKDSFPVGTDFDKPKNKEALEKALERKRKAKEKKRNSEAAMKAAEETTAKREKDLEEYRAKVRAEKGTYQERLQKMFLDADAEEAAKENLKARIMSVKDRNERQKLIDENKDLFL